MAKKKYNSYHILGEVTLHVHVWMQGKDLEEAIKATRVLFMETGMGGNNLNDEKIYWDVEAFNTEGATGYGTSIIPDFKAKNLLGGE